MLNDKPLQQQGDEPSAADFIKDIIRQTIYISTAAVGITVAIARELEGKSWVSGLNLLAYIIGGGFVLWGLREGIRVFQTIAGNLAKFGRAGLYEKNVTDAAKKHLRLVINGVAILLIGSVIQIGSRVFLPKPASETKALLYDLESGSLTVTHLLSTGKLTVQRTERGFVVQYER